MPEVCSRSLFSGCEISVVGSLTEVFGPVLFGLNLHSAMEMANTLSDPCAPYAGTLRANPIQLFGGYSRALILAGHNRRLAPEEPLAPSFETEAEIDADVTVPVEAGRERKAAIRSAGAASAS